MLPCAALAANDLVAVAATGIASATDELPKPISSACGWRSVLLGRCVIHAR
jgi:hypothetical protein